jgi:hypothetical protein
VSFYYSVYTLPNVLPEAGFRNILYCRGTPVYGDLSQELLAPSQTPVGLLIGFLLITFYSLPALALAYTLYMAYK